MRELGPIESDGQWLVAEDREGESWRIECLGDPVAVGARIEFRPLTRGLGAVEKRGRVGELTRVVEQVRDRFVARVVRAKRGGALMLVPFAGVDAPDLLLLERDSKGALHGERVVVVPLEKGDAGKRGRDRTSRARRHRGESSRRSGRLAVRVVERLGPAGDPTADHRAIVWKHDLATEFSRRARLEAEALEAAASSSEQKQRVDLRHLPFITIDPASARDHDDAVFAEERKATPELSVVGAPASPVGKPPGWVRRLWVAIADVSHFVAPGGFIDAEARRRGNSFYFPDRSIPMLPERLSSDLCSLRPGVDRRAVVVEMRFGPDGRICDALFHEAWIRSRARLAYEEAADWLSGPSGDQPARAVEWGDSLSCLDRIAADLGRERTAAGALTLELPEIQVEVDDDGRPVDARVRTRNRAHILIEEAMLAANRSVARALDRADRPTLHRVHPPPSPSKLHELEALLTRFGIAPGGELDAPGVLAEALEAAAELPSAERIHMAALRSMSQARYQAESAGHYALRFEHYLHFTSPIRRYADLEVHRALRALMRDEPVADRAEAESRADRVAIWLSGRERVAQLAERDAEALAGCALMADRESETFEAEVTGATEFGLFVRLARPAVAGLVPIRLLPGRWELQLEDEVLVSAGGRERLGVGDTLLVRLIEVDSDRARLTFSLVDGHTSRRPSRRSTRGGSTIR